MTGRRMNLQTITRAAQARTTALARAEERLDRIADELLDAGVHANVHLAAELTGIPRSTLYRRMRQREAARA